MKIDSRRLKAFILDAGLVSEDQFENASKKAKKTKKKIGDILVSEGLVRQEDLIKLKAYILGIPFVNLRKEIIPPDILKIIPEPIARSNNIIAFRKEGNNLEVAMLDPEDLKTIEFIKKKADLKILPRLTTIESIKHVLGQYQESLETEFGSIIKEESKELRNIPEEKFEEKEGELE